MKLRLALTGFVYGVAFLVGALIITGHLSVGLFKGGSQEVAAVASQEDGSPFLLCGGCYGGYWGGTSNWYGGQRYPNQCCLQPTYPAGCCYYTYSAPVVYVPIVIQNAHQGYLPTYPGANAVDPCSYGVACNYGSNQRYW